MLLLPENREIGKSKQALAGSLWARTAVWLVKQDRHFRWRKTFLVWKHENNLVLSFMPFFLEMMTTFSDPKLQTQILRKDFSVLLNVLSLYHLAIKALRFLGFYSVLWRHKWEYFRYSLSQKCWWCGQCSHVAWTLEVSLNTTILLNSGHLDLQTNIATYVEMTN